MTPNKTKDLPNNSRGSNRRGGTPRNGLILKKFSKICGYLKVINEWLTYSINPFKIFKTIQIFIIINYNSIFESLLK